MINDHRTVQYYFNDGKLKRKTMKIEKNGGQRTVSERNLRKIKLSLDKNPHATMKRYLRTLECLVFQKQQGVGF